MADGGTGRRFGSMVAAELVAPGAAAPDLVRELETLLARQGESAGGVPVPTGDDARVMEFRDAGAAVGTARGLIQRVAERNGAARDTRRMNVRCAVHAGEYGLAGDRPDATAVSLLRGLLSVAEPGGLILSDGAWEQVRARMPLRGVRVAPRGPDVPPGLSAFLIPPADAPWLWWAMRHGAWKGRALLVAVLVAGTLGGAGWWLGHRRPVATAGAPAPTAERVLVLHECDDDAGIGQYAGSGATVAWEIIPEGPGRALRVRFTSSGRPEEAWGVQIAVNRDLRPYTGLRIAHRIPPGGEIRFTLKDAEGEYWEVPLAGADEWRTVDLPFATFIRRADYNTPGSNTVFNLEMIQGIELIQSGRMNSGTLMLDALRAFGPESAPGAPPAP